MMSARLDVFLPLPLTDRGPAYTCGMIARGMAGDELDVTVTTPRGRAHPIAPARIIQVLPHWARYVPYSWVRSIAASKIESTFRSQVNVNPSQMHAAYIWPDASIGTIKELKEAEVKMFREMINCHRGTAKRILDDAYARIGAVPNHTITDASVIAEQEALDAADYIFCPNSMVEASLFENGLPASKIVPASYGRDPCVFMGRPKSFNHVKASPLYLQERYASAKAAICCWSTGQKARCAAAWFWPVRWSPLLRINAQLCLRETMWWSSILFRMSVRFTDLRIFSFSPPLKREVRR